jgi:hypothetical protein
VQTTSTHHNQLQLGLFYNNPGVLSQSVGTPLSTTALYILVSKTSPNSSEKISALALAAALEQLVCHRPQNPVTFTRVVGESVNIKRVTGRKVLSGPVFRGSILSTLPPRKTTSPTDSASAAPQRLAATIGLCRLDFHRTRRAPRTHRISVCEAFDKHHDNSNRGGFSHTNVRASARQPRCCRAASHAPQNTGTQSQRARGSRLPDRWTLVLSRVGTGQVASVSAKFSQPIRSHELGENFNVQANNVSIRALGG